MLGDKSATIAFAILLASLAAADGEQKFAAIGDLKLVSGETLKDCQVGYRTFGNLNANKDNAVLVPTWYLGKSRDLAGSFKAGGLVDPARYYVIAVDALGNGVSTSPSNSKTQGDAAFPAITVRDMVESQHQMLRSIGIHHLRAVTGISMGGMQTFQWITAYPNFMDSAAPIVGSPRPTSYDVMFYGAGLHAVKDAISEPGARKQLLRTFADFFGLALNSPEFYAQHVAAESAPTALVGFENGLLQWDPYDIAVDMDAVLKNDAFKPFGDDPQKAAAAVHAKLVVIVAAQDHCVNPAPALNFAKLVNAEVLVLSGNEGHSSPGANMSKISPLIARLLAGH